MTRSFDRAAQAFVDHVVEEHWAQDARVTEQEAWREAARLETVAKKLVFAIEEFQASIGELDYVGNPVMTPAELFRCLIDYDQDEIGHKASDVLRAAVEGK